MIFKKSTIINNIQTLIRMEKMVYFSFLPRMDFLPSMINGKTPVRQHPTGCPRCGHSVYEAEKILAAKRVKYNFIRS